jgi:hypothetical protein
MLLLMVPGKVMKSVGEVAIDKLLSYVLLVMVHRLLLLFTACLSCFFAVVCHFCILFLFKLLLLCCSFLLFILLASIVSSVGFCPICFVASSWF